MVKPLISIIVPNYMGREIFPDCIRSLLRQDYRNIQIVFVDDSSTDGSHELARRLFSKERRVTITQTPANGGYVGACNHALNLCKGSYLIVTNNDATFPKDWVRQMYRIVRGKRKVLGCSFLMHNKEDALFDRKFEQGWSGAATLVFTSVWRRLSPCERDNDLVEGQNAGVLIIPRSALGDYIFYPDYFAYGEDIELCWRLRLQGYHIVANRRAKMYHYGSFTRQKVASFNKRATYHGTKNRFRNFFLFYERRNLLKLLLPFLLIESVVLLTRPKTMWIRLKAYWWAMTHWREIMKRRSELQRTRKVDDKEMMRLTSYRLLDEQFATTRFRRGIVRGANTLMRWYCTIVGITTFDIKDNKAVPIVDRKSVA